MKSIDFGRAAEDYARHRTGFPGELYDRLQRYEIGVHQQRVVDLGTGTGTLARGFAKRGCDVTGVDPSTELVDQARKLDADANVRIHYVMAEAEATRLPSGSFDLVCAGQAWHWFKRHKAAREARRLLVPGGALVIVHYDWLPLPDTVVALTEDLILRYNHRWALGGSTGIYPEWLTDVRVAGFHAIETFSFDLDVPYSHDAWRGRVRASSGVGASMSRANVIRFDERLRLLLADRFPTEPLLIAHRVWAVVARAPQSNA